MQRFYISDEPYTRPNVPGAVGRMIRVLDRATGDCVGVRPVWPGHDPAEQMAKARAQCDSLNRRHGKES